jgi:ABC-type Mn2+/Zn2+ transport system permease subunit
VIESFLASWPLFHATYLAGAAIAGLLALVGVYVVARDQLFLGAAISQASTLGIATLLWLAGTGVGAVLPWLESDLAASACAVAASVTTALASVRPRRAGGESAEARTAWIFLVAASVPVLLLAHSPHGLEEVHRLMFSTLLGADDGDVLRFAALALATALAVARWHAPLRLFAMDPEMAAAVGVPVGVVGRVIALWLGIAIGFSIQASGLIYTFGCLVLPALAAKNLSRELAPVLWLAPLLAVATAAVAFVIAHHWDLPPAHATVSGLAALVALGWLRRRP